VETPPYVMADPPGRFDTLATWEQWLKELRETVPDAAFNKHRLIEEAERVIAEMRRTPSSGSAPAGIGLAAEGRPHGKIQPSPRPSASGAKSRS
jgi:hypothetical protein